jgi:hypothetical protein
MLNLEELDLNLKVDGKIIDDDTLKKDIITYMPRLYKFTINIYSTIYHRNQTNFPLNEHIQKTSKYFSNNQLITCIDHFLEKGYSQCYIYSYPYIWTAYYYITNHFGGGLFTNVTVVSLSDERPFEREFFLRIAQSFPFMKELRIDNRKAQNNKQFIRSNNDDQILSIIEYPNLTRLDLFNTHDDYVELFLFDTKMSFPDNLDLRVDCESLERVTYSFTRCIIPSNCEKLFALYFDPVNQIGERIKNYFPHIPTGYSADFFSLSK